jgi:hypothetical protein
MSQQWHLPPNYLLGSQGGNLSYTAWGYNFLSPDEAPDIGYCGETLDLHVGPWTRDYETSYGETNTDIRGNNPPGCPSLPFTFGYFSVTRTTKSNVTTMMCYQLLKGVQTDVNFYLPGFTISTSNSPVPEREHGEISA